jgi:hypothetical protein
MGGMWITLRTSYGNFVDNLLKILLKEIKKFF